MKKITDKEKEEILNLYFDEGLNILQISKRVDVSRITITNIVNNYKEKNKIDFSVGTISQIRGRHILHLPKSYLNDIEMNKDDRKVRILVDKKKKEIKICKFE